MVPIEVTIVICIVTAAIGWCLGPIVARCLHRRRMKRLYEKIVKPNMVTDDKIDGWTKEYPGLLPPP